jgi:hypothetical protein
MAAIEQAEVLLGIVAGLLAYLLLVQALAAAALLLAQFAVIQWRNLLTMLTEPPDPAPIEVQDQDQGEPYSVGGGLLKW